MKSILFALLVASAISIRFDLPKVTVADDGLLNKEFQNIADSLTQGRWMNALPAGLALFGKVRKMISASQSPVPALFKRAVSHRECPYKKCVRAHLCKAKKIAKFYLCALFKGHVRKARKALKCLNKVLNAATWCKKK